MHFRNLNDIEKKCEHFPFILQLNSPSNESPVIWGCPGISRNFDPSWMVMQKGCNMFLTLVEGCFYIMWNSIREGSLMWGWPAVRSLWSSWSLTMFAGLLILVTHLTMWVLEFDEELIWEIMYWTSGLVWDWWLYWTGCWCLWEHQVNIDSLYPAVFPAEPFTVSSPKHFKAWHHI